MIFFDFILRNKYSVLGTLLIHLLFFVYSNIQVIEFTVHRQTQDEIVAVMDFSKTETEDIVEEETESSSNENGTSSSQNLQNVAVNQTQEKTTYTNSFSKSAADQSIMDELRAMEAAEFAALSGDNPTLRTNTEKNSAASSNNVNPNLVKEGVEENENAGYGKDVKATANYKLNGRVVQTQKTPSYICQTEGVVRVNIKVNQKGIVVSQTINEGMTNTADECLRTNALKYARKWMFNQKFSDPQRVQGWIEFSFVAQ